MSDFSSGLALTVLGMGLVFFALIVVMLLIMGLDKLFPGRDEETEGVASPEVEAALAAVESPVVAPALLPSPTGDLELLVGGKSHAIAIKDLEALPILVAVNGEEHQVERRDGDQLVVDGHAFTVRVLETDAAHITIGVGDDVFRFDLPSAPALVVAEPVVAAASDESEPISAPLPGKILRVSVRVGERVKRGQEICVIEAMKMENSIGAPRDGLISELLAQPGQLVKAGQAVATFGSSVGAAASAPPRPAATPTPTPPPPPAAAPVQRTAGGEPVNAPLPGKILRVSVQPGARVKRGQELAVIEAMKMENSIGAPRDGVVRDVAVQTGLLVKAGQPLVTLE